MNPERVDLIIGNKNYEIHVRECTVAIEPKKGETGTIVQQRDQKNLLPVPGLGHGITIMEILKKKDIVTVVFFRPINAAEQVPWQMIWGNVHAAK